LAWLDWQVGQRGADVKLRLMKTYRILVHEGAGAPVELAAEMSSDARVVEFARDRLASSRKVTVIEVWSGLVRLCQFGAEAPLAA